MRRAWLILPHLVITLTLFPASTRAQDWSQPWADEEDRPPRVDLSASAGYLLPTRWSSLVLVGSISPVSGVLEQILTRDLRVEPDTQFAAAVTYWRGRYGFRTQAGFSRSSLTIGRAPLGAVGATSIDIDTWLYDVRGAIGFSEYRPAKPVWSSLFPYPTLFR